MNQLDASHFKSLVLQPQVHWIDVRAPVEFEQGSLEGAVNLPILINEERELIGTVYKEKGSQAAMELGHRLVSGSVRDTRLKRWVQELEAFPQSIIFCFRGGLRSQITQSWLSEVGKNCPIVKGGYKALRQFFITAIEEASQNLDFRLVCGATGSGKTDYLYSSGKKFIDLEGLANHRGSAFGNLDTKQPSQINFENKLALQLLQLENCKEPILVEDESRLIGHCLIPDVFLKKIKSCERLTLDVSLEQRVENIFKDYILNTGLGLRQDPKQFELFRSAVKSISKKLGNERALDILKDLDACEREFSADHSLDSNRIWIRKLLSWYYDPAYEFAKKRTLAASK